MKPCLWTFLALVTFATMPSAFAATSLKQVQVSNGERVDLYFDGKVGRSQIKTEYFNDTIQFSLTDVAVYPAKISSVSSGDIAKIFAYQYAPKLVRCRITVRGKAEAFRDRVKLDDRGKLLTISLGDSDTVTAGAAQAIRVLNQGEKGAEAATIPEGPKTAQKFGSGERSLLERIMTGDPRRREAGAINDSPSQAPAKVLDAPAPAKIEAAAPIAAALAPMAGSGSASASASASAISAAGATSTAGTLSTLSGASGAMPLAGGKPLASPLHVLGKFAIVLGLFGLAALALRKILVGGGRVAATKHGSFGAIRRFAANRLGKPAKMIEIVSTHHLGPKKSIVVANIAGRMLVLGISNESINLITQLPASNATPDESDLDDEGDAIVPATAQSSGANFNGASFADALGPSFAGLLDAEDGKPAARAQNANTMLAANAGPNLAGGRDVRSQIRSRLEGLKPL